LRDDDEIRATQRQRAHVLRKVTVVANRDAYAANRGRKDGRAKIARRVVLLFMEARVLGDVHHTRAAEQRAVGVNHRGAVVRPGTVALEQIQEQRRYRALARVIGNVGDRARHRLGKCGHVASCGSLWIEGRERQLRKGDQVRALAAAWRVAAMPRSRLAARL
jgi:hypothetical protein